MRLDELEEIAAYKPADIPEAPHPTMRLVAMLVRDERLRRGETIVTEEPTPPAATVLDLPRELRARHLYIIGKSGSGKTTLLKNLLLRDFIAGDGCAFLDPHGDAAEDVLGLVPAHRIADVTYFDPTNPDSPAFNLLALPYPPPKLASDITSAFRLLFGTSSWGPQLQQILERTLLTLLTDREPHCLKDLETFLTRADVRGEITARNPHSSLRDFWEHTFPTLGKGAVNPVLNKLSSLLAPTSDLERVFSSTANSLDFPALMDGGKIFIANLAKGKLGEEPSRLLGALLATAIEQATLGRADASRNRRPFYFYVDEFQNYATDSFATILSEARKYALSLTLANQTIAQLPRSISDAIFGNVATLVAFQVAADDAARLQREMHATRSFWRRTADDTERPLSSFTELVRDRLRTLVAAFRDYADGVEQCRPRDTIEIKAYRALADRLESNFRTLQDPALSLDVLREIATQKIEVRDNKPLVPFKVELFNEHFPSTEDFLNLKPLHAFVRIERAENVSPVTVPFTSPPNAATRDAILARHRERARASSPAPPPPRPPSPPPAEAIASAATPPSEPEAAIAADDAPQSRRDKYSF